MFQTNECSIELLLTRDPKASKTNEIPFLSSNLVIDKKLSVFRDLDEFCLFIITFFNE